MAVAISAGSQCSVTPRSMGSKEFSGSRLGGIGMMEHLLMAVASKWPPTISPDIGMAARLIDALGVDEEKIFFFRDRREIFFVQVP